MNHEWCVERVWDNGDKTSCGRPVVRKDLCRKHLDDRVAQLKKEIEEVEASLASKKKELLELRGEV